MELPKIPRISSAPFLWFFYVMEPGFGLRCIHTTPAFKPLFFFDAYRDVGDSSNGAVLP